MELTRLPDGEGWRLGDTTFVFDYGRGSAADRFLIRKPPDLVELYVELGSRFHHAKIMELGIAAGGSTALLALLAQPSTLIACELDTEPVAALAEFIEARGLASIVRPFYGVDQADQRRLAEIVQSVIPGGRLDLVIDDASHLYDQTRASFELLYPLVRPGGLFIIEDWAADYAYAKRIEAVLSDPSSRAAEELQGKLAAAEAERPGGPTPLPRIGVELMHMVGSSDEVVRDVRINKHWIAVERGPAELDPLSFRLADHYVDHWGWLSR